MSSNISDDISQLHKLIESLRQENEHLKQLLEQNGVAYIAQKEVAVSPPPTHDENEVSNEGKTLTPQEKIRLYRSLFRGREDVYALRWESAKTNRSGYSPACENEWRPGICNKPKIKCNVCPNQKWKGITDQLLFAHLKGDSFVGVYPLLPGDHCYFLAIDFDKEQWHSDVKAFATVCDDHSISYLIERSQSGNGAHVWIFFKEAIPALVARNLGTALLTLVMQAYPQLSMNSYDRLFPNQDTLPRGGFGNLIALPLQGKRRTQGNSTFINVHDDFLPYADPWYVLEQVKWYSLLEVQMLLAKIQQGTSILDVTYVAQEDESSAPWERKKEEQYPVIPEGVPKTIALVRSNLLYVTTTGLPAKLIHCIRKIAAFQNPEFYRAQALRLPIFDKPRIIHCADIFPDHIGLPRGCEDELLKLMDYYGIQASFMDKRESGNEIDVSFLGNLLPTQESAINALLLHDTGVLSANTGFGKTVVAAKMIAERKISTLILVHRQQLLEQWQERLMAFLGLDKKQIGLVKSGKFKLTGKIDIAMMQSLVKKDVVSDEVNQYGHVIVDECHHLSAASFEKVLKKIPAKYVLGLTATPFRKDGHQPIIFMQCGPIRFQTSVKSQGDSEQKLSVYIKQILSHKIQESATDMPTMYRQLSEDSVRNQVILDDMIAAFNEGRNLLLLTNRVKHLDWFSEQLGVAGIKDTYVLKGGMRKKAQDHVMEQIEQCTGNRILLATGSYIGEGFDDSKLDTLFLALPISWHGTLQQYVGRLHRTYAEKQAVKVYDYLDVHSPVCVRMYQKRIKKYKAMGYDIYE